MSAVRMVVEARPDHPHESAAIRSVAAKLGITSTESLRQAEVDGGATGQDGPGDR